MRRKAQNQEGTEKMALGIPFLTTVRVLPGDSTWPAIVKNPPAVIYLIFEALHRAAAG
jgi:hypothetical protein